MEERKTITNPVKIIRAHCIDCSGGSQSEADNCPCENCYLWPWRKGRNPYRKQLTEEQKAERREKALARGLGRNTQKSLPSLET